MAAYVSPATVVTGTTITSAWGNSVKAATDFLANPPACKVFKAASQSVANGTSTDLIFDSETFDTAAMHDTVTNNPRITATVAGLYVVHSYMEIQTNTDYSSILHTIVANGATTLSGQHVGSINPSGVAIFLTTSTIVKLAVAEYVTARCFHVNGAAAARTVVATFSATWIGLG